MLGTALRLVPSVKMVHSRAVKGKGEPASTAPVLPVLAGARENEMGKPNRVEVEFDERCYQDLVGEAERLGVPVEQVVERATAAWLTDVAGEQPPANDRRRG
jgi:hypothetical protein